MGLRNAMAAWLAPTSVLVEDKAVKKSEARVELTHILNANTVSDNPVTAARGRLLLEMVPQVSRWAETNRTCRLDNISAMTAYTEALILLTFFAFTDYGLPAKEVPSFLEMAAKTARTMLKEESK